MKYIILTLLLISNSGLAEPVEPPICTPAEEDELINELYQANVRHDRKIDALEQDVNILKAKISTFDDPATRRRKAIENLPPARRYPEVTPKPVDPSFIRPIRPAPPKQWDGPQND